MIHREWEWITFTLITTQVDNSYNYCSFGFTRFLASFALFRFVPLTYKASNVCNGKIPSHKYMTCYIHIHAHTYPQTPCDLQ